MKLQTLAICEKCDRPVYPNNGFIVHGNVYKIVDDITERAGLIGNNFPETSEDGTILAEDVGEVAYHSDCLLEALGFDKRHD